MSVLPEAFLRTMDGLPGYDREAFVQCHAAPAESPSVRINPAKSLASWERDPRTGIPKLLFQGKADAFQPDPVPWCPDAFVLKGRPSFVFDPLLHAGVYYVQEASSMFLQHAWRSLCMDLKEARVLDLCAAPGGKSTLLASQPETGMLLSNELIRTRVPALYENVVKWGLPNVFVSNQDPKDFQRLPGFFDVMLVDAPCSGSGLFRRDPEAVKEWSASNVTLCSQRQQRILADALPALREGGVLFYATCSYAREEDEEICDWLLDAQEMESLQIPLPLEWGVVESVSPMHHAYGYRFYPDRLRGEGFFLAAFRKRSGRQDWFSSAKKISEPPLAKEAVLREWVDEKYGLEFFIQQDACMAAPASCLRDLQDLSAVFRLRRSGLKLGTFAREDFNPDHELAMSICMASNIPAIDLDLAEALRFLRKDALAVSPRGKGWASLQYQGVRLGFGKILPNRMNNYYPSEWRIRKES